MIEETRTQGTQFPMKQERRKFKKYFRFNEQRLLIVQFPLSPVATLVMVVLQFEPVPRVKSLGGKLDHKTTNELNLSNDLLGPKH